MNEKNWVLDVGIPMLEIYATSHGMALMFAKNKACVLRLISECNNSVCGIIICPVNMEDIQRAWCT